LDLEIRALLNSNFNYLAIACACRVLINFTQSRTLTIVKSNLLLVVVPFERLIKWLTHSHSEEDLSNFDIASLSLMINLLSLK
jgi:hypothetical protein